MKLKNCKEGTIVVAKQDIACIPEGAKGSIVKINLMHFHQQVLVNWEGFTGGHRDGINHKSYTARNSWWVSHEDIKRYKEEV